MNSQIHVGFYLRSATGNVADLHRQRKILEREFARQGFDSASYRVTSYVDTHQSGRNRGPELVRLLDDVANKRVQVVMVSKMNRVSRSLSGLSDFYDLLAKHQFRFISENENIDSVNWPWMQEEVANESR